LGSVNLSIVVTKYIGKFDIKTKGSGNAGGTNVARTMGAGWGIGVIVAEILKGFIVGLFAKFIFPVDPFLLGGIGSEITGAVAVLACQLGNVYPIFHKFKGGKGVTTCGAVMAVLDIRIFIILVSTFLLIFFISRMVSLGSIVASVGMPISVAIVYNDKPYWWMLFIITFIMSAVLIYRHKSNIVRIINGTENKFFTGKKK
jgi:glycerol-3-phosphate acyltransferase PlsY